MFFSLLLCLGIVNADTPPEPLKLLFELAGHETRVLGVAASPDGKTVASCDEYGVLFIWDVKTGRKIKSVQAHKNAVSVSFSEDGDIIHTAGEDGSLKSWRATDLALTTSSEGHGSRIMTMQRAGKATLVTVGRKIGECKFWDAKSLTAIESTLTAPDDAINIAFTGDWRFAAFATRPTGVSLFDSKSKKLVVLDTKDREIVYALVFNPKGGRVGLGRISLFD